MWLPGSQERPKSLRHVRRGMSCSEVRVIGVVASSNIALIFFFFFVLSEHLGLLASRKGFRILAVKYCIK